MHNLIDILVYANKHYRNRIATESPDGTKISYGNLYDRCRELKEKLEAFGYSRRDHIGVYFSNSFEFIFAYFASQMLTSTAVLIPYGYKSNDLASTSDKCDLDYILTSRERLSLVKESLGEDVLESLSLHGVEVVKLKKKQKASKHSASVLILTSGSSGRGKAVMLSGDGIFANAKAYTKHLKLGPADTVLIVLPLTSSFAHTTQMVAHLMVGGKIIFGEKIYLPQLFIKQVRKARPTISGLIPSMLVQVLEILHDGAELSLKKVVVAGAPIPGSLGALFRQKMPNATLVKAYGLTEAGPRVAQSSYSEGADPLLCGRALPGVKVRIDSGKKGMDPIGEILVSSPANMLGYYKSTKETKKILQQGWLRTGDLGSLDDGGNLRVVGRKKNLIIKRGFKIIPEAIEDFLLTYPGVREVLVKSKADHNYDERIVVNVVMKSGMRPVGEKIIEFCRTYLSPIEVPDEIHFVPFISKNLNSKIER